MGNRTLLLTALLAGALLLGCVRQPDLCRVCLREIHSQVRATLTLEDGERITACCPRCALHYQENSGRKVRSIQVTDYATHIPLSLGRAWLVEGSDETPCVHAHSPVMDSSGTPMQICFDRCMPSLIAFAGEAPARAFMKEHGGRLYAPGAFHLPAKSS